MKKGINSLAKPSGTGCVECLATDGWWLHLRRCAECGHIGCCDTSPNQHASKHNAVTGHPYHEFRAGRAVVLRLPYGRFLCRPESPRSSLAPIRSTGTRTGWPRTVKLANTSA